MTELVWSAPPKEAMDAVPEGRYVDIDGGRRIHYHEAGEGTSVIFVHGGGPGASGWSNFNGNYPYLAENGYRTLIPDALGFGYSSKPEEAKYHLDYLVDGLQQFTDALDLETYALVGNSMGGAMCILSALNRPERVTRLVLMAPGGLEEREAYMQMPGIRAMIKAFFSPGGITRDGMREVFELQLYDASLVTDDIIEQRYQLTLLQPKTVISTSRVPNLSARLGELAPPIQAFWGMNDQFCPSSGALRLAAACKNARITLLTECGHWVMVEHRDFFNRMCLDFLNES
jgi:4,5:9,10-diseco-3-hydroxy-5,9,17-trioxoandrosta-1(10),2-diene-4-oate hydrolase